MRKLLLFVAAVVSFGAVMGQQKMVDAGYYGHLYLNSMINGQPARLIFDTGAPYTCMDSTYLADSKLQYQNIGYARMGGTGNGQERVRFIFNELTYTVAGKEYRSSISPIIQLKSIVGDYADGLLGISGLEDKIIAIDYQNGKMGFWDKLEAGDTEGFTAIPIRFEDNRIYVPLTVTIREGKKIEGEAQVDLGSGGSVSLTSVVAKRYGLGNLTPLMHFGIAVGGIGGAATSSDFRANSVALGPFTLNGVTMDFSNNTDGAMATKEHIGLIGNDVWDRFDMIIDLPGRRMYLRPNARFDEPYESPTRGFTCTYRGLTLGCWVVNGIYKDSNAEKAGLKSGDRIVAVGGRSVKEMSYLEYRTCFDDMKTISLTVQRGPDILDITFNVDEPKI